MFLREKEAQGDLQGKKESGKCHHIFQRIEGPYQWYPCQPDKRIADPQAECQAQHAKIEKSGLFQLVFFEKYQTEQ